MEGGLVCRAVRAVDHWIVCMCVSLSWIACRIEEMAIEMVAIELVAIGTAPAVVPK